MSVPRAFAPLAAALLLASCGPAPAPDLALTLTDASISLDRAAIPAGHRVLAITNAGTGVHELEVLRTDEQPSALPYDTRNAQAQEKDKIAERENIPAGATKRLSVDLTAGTYVVICNLPGHYAAGMRGGFAAD